jgi:uncharacterized protein
LSADQHLFTLFGRRFLLDVPTGALLELDEEAARALTNPAGATAGATAEIAALREKGLLLPDPLRDNPRHGPADGPLKALCLHAAHDCNLRCAYCFAGSGSFGGGRGIMPPAVGKAAIDLLLDASGPIRELEVDFFGGEPLLGMDTVRAVVAHGRERATAIGKKINFTLTTNGILLDGDRRHKSRLDGDARHKSRLDGDARHKSRLDGDTLDFLNGEGVSLVLSLDGRPDVHDRLRRAAGGGGSYERCARGIARAVASRGGDNYYVRGTFTRHNLDFTADARHLLDLGFARLSLEPAVAPPEEDYALRPGDLPRVEEEYERLAALYLERARAGRPFTFFHFEVDLDHGPCLGKRLSGCGAGRRYLAVTPDGDLYPCHQFVGRGEYRLGDLEHGVTRKDLAEAFAGADIFHKKGCLDCWARYFCGGGCHANADFFHGTILTPDETGCRLLRKRLECALGIKAMRAEENNMST